MLTFLKNKNNTQVIINFRFIAIFVQLILVVIGTFVLNYQLSINGIIAVILCEFVFTLASKFFYGNKGEAGRVGLLIQVLADVIFLAALLNFSGGATNAFVSLLLIPIAMAAVCLPMLMLMVVFAGAVAAYSILLYLMPEHAMHHVDMQQHFVGMWVNFLFSAVVVAFVVGSMALAINKRERAMANIREDQLKQEKLLTLGVASAQVTHQLATPIATIQLLIDELDETYPNDEVIEDIQQQLSRCTGSISRFRQLASDVKEQRISKRTCLSVYEELVDQITLNFPDIRVEQVQKIQVTDNLEVNADSSLIPALLNLVQNAIRASKANDSLVIAISSEPCAEKGLDHWQLIIRDYGKGFNLDKLSELGAHPVSSQQGLGMAVFLSHASFERLGIKLALSNDENGGAVAKVSIPIVSD